MIEKTMPPHPSMLRTHRWRKLPLCQRVEEAFRNDEHNPSLFSHEMFFLPFLCRQFIRVYIVRGSRIGFKKHSIFVNQQELNEGISVLDLLCLDPFLINFMSACIHCVFSL